MPRAIAYLAERRPFFLIPFFLHSPFATTSNLSSLPLPPLPSAHRLIYLLFPTPLFGHCIVSFPPITSFCSYLSSTRLFFFAFSHLLSTIIPLRTSLISHTAPLIFPSSTVLLHSFTMLHYGSEKSDAGTFSSFTFPQAQD